MTLKRWLAAALLLVSACGTQPAAHAKPAARPTPTLPSPVPTPSRPAPALVQIENAADSEPHWGLQKADLVFEYLTEGGVTRDTAVFFQPSGASKIEPIRSARLATLKIQKAYGGVLFYSGASDHVLGLVYKDRLPALDENSEGGRYLLRDPSRRIPHNLYTTGDLLRQGIQQKAQQIYYGPPIHGEPVGQGEAVEKFSFEQSFAHHVSYVYSGADRTYTYSSLEMGTEADAANGGQHLKIANVVLLKVAHHPAGYTEDVLGAEGIDFDLQGTGAADIYTRGQRFGATWDLTQADQPLKLLGPDGKSFLLPDGLTWFHLVDP